MYRITFVGKGSQPISNPEIATIAQRFAKDKPLIMQLGTNSTLLECLDPCFRSHNSVKIS
ncbi:MAG TPA: hypothetical protein VL134_12575 [Leptolyngbya sp.]|nr:hypothetical protein [Leptolyngbya sp.]